MKTFPFIRIKQLAQSLRHLEWAPVVLLLIAVALGWGFLELADVVIEGDTASLDESILLAMRNSADQADPLGPRWMEEIARDITALGGIAVLFLVMFTVVSFLWTLTRRRMAIYMLVAVIGALAIGYALKLGYARPRPDLVPHGSHVYTHSFPSGHAVMAAATYLTLGLLVARLVTNRYLQVLVVSLAIAITLAVGVSRVYLGVHWPSDVLAGWALGTLWALVCWVAAAWLQTHGDLEREVDVPMK
ncbi:MAG: phosphatase PAP2 family protein [Pirellulales bacterium]